MGYEYAQVYKKFFVLMTIVVVSALFFMGCAKKDDSSNKQTATPAIYAIVNDGGVLCSNDTMITYRTYQPLDTFNCNQEDGLIASGSQNLKMYVTVSNFSPVKGETVIVMYSFKKDDILVDNCEISADAGLHERLNDGTFTITATGTTSTYTLHCIDGNSTIDAQFVIRAPAFGG